VRVAVIAITMLGMSMWMRMRNGWGVYYERIECECSDQCCGTVEGEEIFDFEEVGQGWWRGDMVLLCDDSMIREGGEH
jgi:hypothetical protein